MWLWQYTASIGIYTNCRKKFGLRLLKFLKPSFKATANLNLQKINQTEDVLINPSLGVLLDVKGSDDTLISFSSNGKFSK